MANETDVSFGFDPKPFLNGLAQVEKGMSGLVSSAGKIAYTIGKSLFSALAKLEILKAGFRAAAGLVHKLANQIPEIGKSFSIVNEIITKNLLWPLRQELAPFLQRLLDWARDNRGLFLRFGEALAGAFRVGVSMARAMLDAVKTLVEVIKPSLAMVFGDISQGVERTVNLMLAKFAVGATFLVQLLPPIVEGFGALVNLILPRLVEFVTGLVSRFGDMWEAVKGIGGAVAAMVAELFSAPGIVENLGRLISDVIAGGLEVVRGLMEGFASGLRGAGAAFAGIVEQVRALINNIVGANSAGDSVATVFRTVGDILGQAVRWIAQMTEAFLKGFVPAVRNIMTPLQQIVDAFLSIVESLFTGVRVSEVWRGIFRDIGEALGTAAHWVLEMTGSLMGGFAEGLRGFAEGIRGIIGPIESIADAFLSIVESLFTGARESEVWRGIFRDIGAALGTAVHWVLEMIGSLTGEVAAVLRGFAEGIRGIIGPIESIADTFRMIFSSVDMSTGALRSMKDTLYDIGVFVGTTLRNSFQFIADIFRSLVEFIQRVDEGLRGLLGTQGEARAAASGSSALEVLTDVFNPLTGGAFGMLFRTITGAPRPGAKETTVRDAIITKSGDVVHTDPDDTIVALKKYAGGGSSGAGDITQTVNVSLTVTEGSAREAGRRFADGMNEGLRVRILDDMVAGGY